MIIRVPDLQTFPLTSSEDQIRYAQSVLELEAETLRSVADRLDSSFTDVISLFRQCEGRIGVTGTGKSADVGQKIAGPLCSTGTMAYHFDATKAVHGDLGMVGKDDVILILSHSGESEEIVRLLAPLRQEKIRTVGLTGNANGTLAQLADVALVYGPIRETCPLELAPSASTTTMLALADALAFVLMRLRNFTREDFARFHPAGSLGRKLLQVEAVMRQGKHVRIAPERHTVREIFARQEASRRTGAVMLINDHGQLSGVFTDSDLARLFESRQDHALDQPIERVMTRDPICLQRGARLEQAAELLRQHKISELPIVDEQQRPVGLIDVTDLLGILSPPESSEARERSVA